MDARDPRQASYANDIELADVEEVKRQLGSEPLIVVINRSVVTLEASPDGVRIERPPGGAASAVYDSLRQAGGGVVVATAITDIEREIAASGLLFSVGEKVWILPILVSEDTFRIFYNEFANPALWLIHHRMAEKLVGRPGFPDLLRHPRHWMLNYLPWARTRFLRDLIFTQKVITAFEDGYRKVNRQYAEVLLATFGDLPDAKIIIQDYHFYLLPRYIREANPRATISHFIHIPWESPAYLRMMVPGQILRELIEALLANDVIGFHTRAYALQFMRSAKSVLPVTADQKNGMISYRGHTTLVAVNPISIDVANLRQVALQGETGAETQRYVQAIRRRLGERMLIGRWDRTDLSKGIVEGLDALDFMLTHHPSVRDDVVMLAMLQPSRLDVPQYRALYNEIKQRVQELNGKWSPQAGWDGLIEDDEARTAFLARLEDEDEDGAWQWPLIVVDFSNKPYTFVVASQIAADIGLVNALADGMNLVGKEFATNNYPPFLRRDFNRALRGRYGRKAVSPTPGIIVGSRLMGAYPELRGALIAIDPRSVAETADGLYQAYSFQRLERSMSGGARLRLLARRVRGRPGPSQTIERMAERASEQVSRNQLRDWMDRILLDVEVVQLPQWAEIVKMRGIESVRRSLKM